MLVDDVPTMLEEVLRNPSLAHYVAPVLPGSAVTETRHPKAPYHYSPPPYGVMGATIRDEYRYDGSAKEAAPMDNIKLVHSRNFYPTRVHPITRQSCGIDLIVLHSMEHPEKPTAAEDVAAWFAGSSAPQASCSYCVDCDSIVQCVKDSEGAWHAPGANHNSIGIEHAGYARQTEDEWVDGYSKAMLRLSSQLVAKKCAEFSIPVEFVPAEKLLQGARGITTHAEVSKAARLATKRGLQTSVFYNRKNPSVPLGAGHTDPGENFPMDMYLSMVRGEL